MQLLFGDRKTINRMRAIKVETKQYCGITSVTCSSCGNMRGIEDEDYSRIECCFDKITLKNSLGDTVCNGCGKLITT